MSPRPKHPRRRSAFTLVEAIATMAILGACGAIFSSMIFSAIRSYNDASSRAQVESEISTAMSRIVRELRWVTLNPDLAQMAPQIASVAPTTMTWNTNYSLSLVGTDLQYVENGGSAVVLLQNVTAFTISTYDDSNAALASSLSGAACNSIRRIQLQITASRYGATQTLRTRVFPRTLAQGG